MKPTKIKNVLATSSLNGLRLDVKYDLDRRLSPVHRIILEIHGQAIAGTASDLTRNPSAVRLRDVVPLEDKGTPSPYTC